MSFQCRVTCLDYYWENMKVDMSKVLLSDKRDPIKAKSVSLKAFAIHSDIKNLFIQKYAEYTRQIFIVKYFAWRWNKVRYLKIQTSFDWKKEL